MKKDLSFRTELIPFLPQKYTKVLEIGCNRGNFAKNLKSGCEIWGIEPNSSFAKEAKDRIKNILLGTYEEHYEKIPENYFDLIICNDVIEHLQDHDMFFETIKTKMTVDGHLIGSIPNVRYYRNLYNLLWKKDWKYEEKGILDRTHLHFFTQKSLIRTLNAHKFNIKRFEGINKSNIRSLRLKIFFLVLSLFSFTTLSDIRFQQFGFQICKK